ncbi:hypothetical protein FB45DRAFT_1054156 [Roridomyces roridus]|uniref:HBL/NHE enterotoxin family protein n=1 Tax=Roridomyces roridus TaxID=1738132 RepID=A0AAD7FWW4_9AGAR|nr:hypothetical protein FB45DRAFT_1054156 [Roridomyces roridus]
MVLLLPVALASFALFSRAQMTVPTIPTLTPAQQLSFSVAMTTMAQTPAAQDMLAQDVNNAAAAAAGILQNFTKIATQLLEIDNLHLQSATFEPTWLTFRDRFNTLLQQSKNFASEVATYADSFDSAALPLVTDDTLDLPTRVEVIQAFIDQTTGFQNSSDNFANLFGQLSMDMQTFTGNFANFSSTRASNDSTTIDNLNIQIAKIQGEMRALSLSMEALGIAVGGIVLATPAALAFFPEAAPFIVIGAAIAAGVIAATEIGLEVTFAVEQSMLDAAQSEREALLNQISLINSTQNLLDQTVTQDINATASSILLFNLVWEGVASDSSSILTWLNEGADLVDAPAVVGTFVNRSSTIYASLSTALSNYAVIED